MCTILVIFNQSQGDDLINQIKFGNSKLTSQFIDSHSCFGLVPDKQDATSRSPYWPAWAGPFLTT